MFVTLQKYYKNWFCNIFVIINITKILQNYFVIIILQKYITKWFCIFCNNILVILICYKHITIDSRVL